MFSNRSRAVCLVLGPVLFAASTFFWAPNGTYTATCGALIVLALMAWTYGLLGVLDLLRERMPVYASLVSMVLVCGAIGGADFGVRGLYDELFGFSREASIAAVEHFPTAANLIFYWPGPLFPFGLLLLGAGLLKSRVVSVWPAVLLCAAGVAFPLSRIPRLPLPAHGVDVLLLAAFGYLAYRLWRSAASAPASARVGLQ